MFGRMEEQVHIISKIRNPKKGEGSKIKMQNVSNDKKIMARWKLTILVPH